MQTRQAQTELTAYTLNLDKRTIPAKAVLHDFRVGPGHEGLAAHNPNVASFHFNVTDEIVARTAIVSAA
jgi:Cys-tRNA synthase (O-phospho-L-seryl-tRNA:Cys-tRNA synthase)